LRGGAAYSSESDICSPERKKPCNSPRKVLDQTPTKRNNQTFRTRLLHNLRRFAKTLTSVESGLQNLENIFERVSVLEKSISNFGTELSKLSNKTKEIEKTASDVETAMAFTRLRR